jgi:hypothetical protein
LAGIEQVRGAERNIQPGASGQIEPANVEVERNRHVKVGRDIDLTEDVTDSTGVEAAQRQAAVGVFLQIEFDPKINSQADVCPGSFPKADRPETGIDSANRSAGCCPHLNRVTLQADHLVGGQPSRQGDPDGKVGCKRGVEIDLNRVDREALLTENALGPVNSCLTEVKFIVSQRLGTGNREGEPDNGVT